MRFLKKQKGSILLETAIVFPIFLLFIFFLWTLIRISVMQMALDKATSEVAQTISHYAYYGSVVADGGQKMENALKEKTKGQVNQYIDNKQQQAGFDGEAAKEFITGVIDDVAITKFLEASIAQSLGGKNGVISNPKIRKSFIEAISINKDKHTKSYFGGGKLDIINVKADSVLEETAYYTIEASYEVPLNIPMFEDKKIILYSQSSRVMWTS